MKFIKTKIDGVLIIDIEPIFDARGFFSRSWCRDEFSINGLDPNLSQCSFSYNEKKGTVRGMHFQDAPYQETKVVRCTSGSIFDVVVDMRKHSKSYMKWISVELSFQNKRMIYVPMGVAHGFQSLEKKTEVFYMVSKNYNKDFSRTINWQDPQIAIDWPQKSNYIISENDKNAPFINL